MNELARIKKNPRSREFRHRLVERYRMGYHDELEIWQLYGVSRSLLHKWNCQYYQFRIQPRPNPRKMKAPKKKSDKARIRELERQLKEANKAYEDERLARIMWETMVDIAEKQFNIPIRKKPGAKP